MGLLQKFITMGDNKGPAALSDSAGNDGRENNCFPASGGEYHQRAVIPLILPVIADRVDRLVLVRAEFHHFRKSSSLSDMSGSLT